MQSSHTFILWAFFFLAFACAHDQPCIETNFCPSEVPAALTDDPGALRQLIVDARMRRFPEACFSCEEGTACASCERLVGLALQKLSSIRTDKAAQVAASIVIDERLHWDAGAALTVAREVSSMGTIVLPYLQPHTARSPLAAHIVRCLEHHEPCY